MYDKGEDLNEVSDTSIDYSDTREKENSLYYKDEDDDSELKDNSWVSDSN